ncbi:MAG TPA: galactokinase [Chryseosolibacter sp.]|nr:galactokinase [Chryseosolibacter sp.]
MDQLETEIQQKFRSLFSKEPLVVRAPGRINLIGEHTDYNDGFVMPAAIDKKAVFAIAFSSEEKCLIHSTKYGQTIEVTLDNTEKLEQPAWANYLLGVMFQFIERGYEIRPFNCVFGGDIPIGAGLSSSAAIECGFGFALNELHSIGLPKIEIVKIAQWAEHNYAGVKCGIMDQFASVMGKDEHVILLDCRSLTHKYFPIKLNDYVILLCDTRVKHSLVDSEYNTRRTECEIGVKMLKQHYKDVKSLRDVSLDMLLTHESEFEDRVFQRCRYVVEEIDRVQRASKDLELGNIEAFGRKMYETHEGLSKKYGVSCDELDFFVSEARKFPEILGARMMGGGFGGCTINIVKKSFADSFADHLKREYKKRFRLEMQSYYINIEDGAGVANVSAEALQ